MQHVRNSGHPNRPGGLAARCSWRFHWGRTLGFVAAMAALTASAQHGQQVAALDPNRLNLVSQANRFPDANDVMELEQQAQEQKQFENINAQRRKRLSEESAALIKLAADLKAEMDKTDKDTLNLNVIRKADEIEKIAHDVKNTMKLTVGQG
jgi:hypothetical protein